MSIDLTYGSQYSHLAERYLLQMYYRSPEEPITAQSLMTYVIDQLGLSLIASERINLYKRTLSALEILFRAGKLSRTAIFTAKNVLQYHYKPIALLSSFTDLNISNESE